VRGSIKLADDVKDVLRRSTVDGLLLRLPPERLEPTKYQAVAKALKAIGGKWKGGNTQAHAFESCPKSKLAEVLGTGVARNIQKELGYFPTPDDLATELVDMADVRPGDRVLEPSAGRGAICKAILSAGASEILACEIDPEHVQHLQKVLGNPAWVNLGDFLELNQVAKFDRVVANPPFGKCIEMKHARRMFDWLKPGGRMACILPTSVMENSTRAHREFRQFCADNGGEFERLPDGAFEESGTNVSTCVLTMNKAL
jgi:predicted RNA methylase